MNDKTDIAKPSAQVQEILNVTRGIFPEFKLFRKVGLSDYHNPHAGNVLLEHFGTLPPEDRKALSAYVFEKRKDKGFGDVLRWLRIVNGIAGTDFAETILQNREGYTCMDSIEKEKSLLTRPQLARLRDWDRLALTDEQKEALTGLWHQAKYDAPMQHASVEALFRAIARQCQEHESGLRPLDQLMTRNEAVRELIQLRQLDVHYNARAEFKSVTALSRDMFPEAREEHLYGLLTGKNIMKKPALERIAEKLGVAGNSREMRLLRKLPMLHRWLEQAQMETTPAEILEAPRRFSSKGAWLQALREAAVVMQEEARKGVGKDHADVYRQQIEQFESDKCNPQPHTIDAWVRQNMFQLPADEQGKMAPWAERRFRYLMDGVHPDKPKEFPLSWEARVRTVPAVAPMRDREWVPVGKPGSRSYMLVRTGENSEPSRA